MPVIPFATRKCVGCITIVETESVEQGIIQIGSVVANVNSKHESIKTPTKPVTSRNKVGEKGFQTYGKQINTFKCNSF